MGPNCEGPKGATEAWNTRPAPASRMADVRLGAERVRELEAQVENLSKLLAGDGYQHPDNDGSGETYPCAEDYLDDYYANDTELKAGQRTQIGVFCCRVQTWELVKEGDDETMDGPEWKLIEDPAIPALVRIAATVTLPDAKVDTVPLSRYEAVCREADEARAETKRRHDIFVQEYSALEAKLHAQSPAKGACPECKGSPNGPGRTGGFPLQCSKCNGTGSAPTPEPKGTPGADRVREAAEKVVSAWDENKRIENIQGEDADETCTKCADPEDCECDWEAAYWTLDAAFKTLQAALAQKEGE